VQFAALWEISHKIGLIYLGRFEETWNTPLAKLRIRTVHEKVTAKD
jgi:hypothetical protein